MIKLATGVLFFPLVLWSIAALLLTGSGPTLLRGVVVGCLLAGLFALSYAGVDRKTVALAWGLLVVCGSLVFFSARPSHDRAWSLDQSKLPKVTLDEVGFVVRDQRAFRYRSVDDADPGWEDQRYRFDQLVGADMGVEQFSSLQAVAHTFVSFRFADGRVLVASVEIRKEQGESFSALKGLFRHYEKMVVLGDERDLVELRAVHRKDLVYLHPMQVDKRSLERFLRAVLTEAQQIERSPVFYNTLTASCVSSLATHLRAAGVGADVRMFLPGYADALAWDLGWLDQSVSIHEHRRRNTINQRAEKAAGTPAFGAAIREH